MDGKAGTAPCGHPGIHVIGNYVQCTTGCDSIARQQELAANPRLLVKADKLALATSKLNQQAVGAAITYANTTQSTPVPPAQPGAWIWASNRSCPKCSAGIGTISAPKGKVWIRQIAAGQRPRERVCRNDLGGCGYAWPV